MKWSFKTDIQRDDYIKEITDKAASSVYHHQQVPDQKTTPAQITFSIARGNEVDAQVSKLSKC